MQGTFSTFKWQAILLKLELELNIFRYLVTYMIKPDAYYFLEEQTPYCGDSIMFLSLMLQLALRSITFKEKENTPISEFGIIMEF